MQLRCPYCGERDETEFRFGGPAAIIRPGPPEQVSDEAWADFLYQMNNEAGWQAERWCHVGGCGSWFHIWRHTLTHDVSQPTLVGRPMAERPVE
jgi:heterotetrameric sarcosine oxidase delta subunit